MFRFWPEDGAPEPKHVAKLCIIECYDIFINCNFVATRWQQYSTHLHKNNT